MPTLNFIPHHKQPIPSKRSEQFDSIVLRPGVNKISDSELKLLESNTTFTQYVEKKIVEILPEAIASETKTLGTTKRKTTKAITTSSATA